MPFQNVSTPRIYLNLSEYLASTGVVIDPVFRTLPVIGSEVSAIPDLSDFTLTDSDGNSIAYIAILGHSASEITLTGATTIDDIINGTIGSTTSGFSIMGTDAMPTAIAFDNGNAGSILLGTFYDFPHTPDLSLTLSYDYSGVTHQTTKGGASLSNSFYNKPPKWGNLGAWELGGDPNHAKSGRRIWDLSFSYFSDSSIFPDNAGLANEDPNSTSLTLLEANTFQRCIHLLNGGQNSFIFQPDNTVDGTSPKPDQLAICKFDMNKFSFQQTLPKLYSVKCRIVESW